MACRGSNGEVGNGGVLCFTATMRNHCGVSSGLGHRNRIQCFGQTANLVELDQDRVANAPVDALLEDFGVGNKQVIAHQLHLVANLVRQQFPTIPIRLVKAVLNGNNWVLLRKIRQVVGEFGTTELLTFAGQVIDAITVKF